MIYYVLQIFILIKNILLEKVYQNPYFFEIKNIKFHKLLIIN